jgi:hypothetical protein
MSENIQDLRHLNDVELRAYWATERAAKEEERAAKQKEWADNWYRQKDAEEEEFHRKRGRSKIEHKGEWPKAKE